MNGPLRVICIAAALVLVPSEVWCVLSSRETQGDLPEIILAALTCLNLLFLGMLWWHPKRALMGMLCLATLIIPYQVFLLNRLVRITNEMMQIVHNRQQVIATGGVLPRSLDDYQFADPDVRRFIYKYAVSEDGRDFHLQYFVEQPGISHWYSSKTGWGYYGD